MIKCLAALCSLPSLYRKSLVTARNVKQMLTFVRHKNTRARAHSHSLTQAHMQLTGGGKQTRWWQMHHQQHRSPVLSLHRGDVVEPFT